MVVAGSISIGTMLILRNSDYSLKKKVIGRSVLGKMHCFCHARHL